MNIKNQICCGCAACVSVCPKSCIEMQCTKEGFYHASVIDEQCVDCGKCLSVCPVGKIVSGRKQPIAAYAAYHQQESVRKNATSGGIFYQLAKDVIQKGGIVYGAAFDEHMKLRHIAADNMRTLQSLCGSKYLQSDLRGVYEKIQKDLEAGKTVFFVGTPCQVSALHAVAGEPEKLLTADLICHGVPAPGLFQSYLGYLEKRYRGKITDYCFRSKEQSNSRMSYTAKVTLKAGGDSKKVVYLNGDEEPYAMRFLSNALQCESCFQCPYTSTERPGDITLGDYWGYETAHPELSDVMGVSLVLVRSQRGMAALSEAKNLVLIKTEKERYLERNRHLISPPAKNPERDTLYRAFAGKGFSPYFYHRFFLPRGYKRFILKRRIRRMIEWKRKLGF